MLRGPGSMVQLPVLQLSQHCWLGFPGDYISNFLSSIFVLWCSLEVNSSLPITFLIGMQFHLCCKENLVLPLNRCSARSFLLGLKPCRLPSPPHPIDTHCQKLQPQSSTLGSTIPHTLTSVFLQTFRFSCSVGAAGFMLLCFLFFSAPGEIYCCKAPWAHWQGKTITQHFQSWKSVIVIYTCATFQHSPTAQASSFQFNIVILMHSVQRTLQMGDVSGLPCYEINSHTQIQCRDLGLTPCVQWSTNYHQHFHSSWYSYIYII